MKDIMLYTNISSYIIKNKPLPVRKKFKEYDIQAAKEFIRVSNLVVDNWV